MDSPLKWHGGKAYLASKLWAISKEVMHIHRVELFAGSLAFTLATEPEGYSEVVNDLNRELTNFWSVLRDPERFTVFCRMCEATPFSQIEFNGTEGFGGNGEPIPRAWAFFVHCRQSMSGRMKNFAPLTRNRIRRGMNEQASAWLTCVEGLPAVHERLKRIVVLNRPAVEVIKSQDGPNTLFYCDPPYLHETRTTTGEYAHEMSEADHLELLETLGEIEGKFILSGYPSDLYENLAATYGWGTRTFDLPNNSAGGKTKRRMTECVWTNF